MNATASDLAGKAPIGRLLREWRQRRRMSQLDFACEAEISSKHLSFLETGRSQPSREMLLKLADLLEVPLRERNTMLIAAGFAPIFSERALSDPHCTPHAKPSIRCSRDTSRIQPSQSIVTGRSLPRTPWSERSSPT